MDGLRLFVLKTKCNKILDNDCAMTSEPSYVSPLQGYCNNAANTQGCALGWYVPPLRGNRALAERRFDRATGLTSRSLTTAAHNPAALR